MTNHFKNDYNMLNVNYSGKHYFRSQQLKCFPLNKLPKGKVNTA